MRNPLHVFFAWLHYVLYEERDDPYAPNHKKRVLHNVHIMQVWASMTIIFGLPFGIFCVTVLIRIPYFIIGYLVFVGAASTLLYGGRYYEKHVNTVDPRKRSSASDLNAEIR